MVRRVSNHSSNPIYISTIRAILRVFYARFLFLLSSQWWRDANKIVTTFITVLMALMKDFFPFKEGSFKLNDWRFDLFILMVTALTSYSYLRAVLGDFLWALNLVSIINLLTNNLLLLISTLNDQRVGNWAMLLLTKRLTRPSSDHHSFKILNRALKLCLF